MPNPVIIVDYDPTWPDLFERLRAPVALALGNTASVIEHIGSTSVPGLAAKPIIDIEVVVHSQADVSVAVERLLTLGYVHQGERGVPGRKSFETPKQMTYHHLYVCVEGSDENRRQIAFRDYLRSHPAEALDYGELKKRLAAEYRDNRDGYTEAKSAFINSILAKAMR